MKKKILFVFYSLEAGGAEQNLINIGNRLSEKINYTIVFFVFTKSNTLLPLISKNIKIIYSNSIKKNGIGEKIRKYLIFGYKLSILPNIMNYDYMIAIHEHLPEIAVRSIKYYHFSRWKEVKQKSVLIVHFSPIIFIKTRNTILKRWLHKYLYKFRSKNFSKIITISEKIFNEHYSIKNVPEMIFNPINISLIKRLSCKGNEVNHQKYFLHIGSIQKIKNQDFIIESLSRSEEDIEFEILFVGRVLEQEYFELLLKKIDNYKIKDKIHFHGELDNPFPILKNSLGLINVSKYESFSYVVHEAMVLKIPVISFLRESNRFITKNNVVAVEENTEKFIYTLNQISNNEIDIQAKVEEAYRYVQKFNINKIVEKYDKLFTK